MPKLKIGDKVKIINNRHSEYYGTKEGTIKSTYTYEHGTLTMICVSLNLNKNQDCLEEVVMYFKPEELVLHNSTYW